ncbi:MAG: hypothetical protein AAFO83_00060 [Cyanobacteria bacterium J06607_13]
MQGQLQSQAGFERLKSLGVKINALHCEVSETWQKQQYEPITVKMGASVAPDEIQGQGQDIDWGEVAGLLLLSCHQMIWREVIPVLERTGRLEPLVTEKLAGVPIDNQPERWQETGGIDRSFHYALAADTERKRREQVDRQSVAVQPMM